MDTQKINIDFLSDLYKIIKNTVDTLDRFVGISDDIALGVVLTEYSDKFGNMAKETESALASFGKKPKQLGDTLRGANHFASGLQTGWHTLFDKSPSRIAELVMQNALDYIIVGYKVSKKESFEAGVQAVNKKALTLQEGIFEEMKKFL
ncbi:MAG: hypothetical protein FWD76_00930 [Firmicutes bacterium]|nr:hypothetical protein [Bacillota bacterium]